MIVTVTIGAIVAVTVTMKLILVDSLVVSIIARLLFEL